MKNYSRRSRESAASEAIGAIMLISVVVLAVAIISVVLTSQPAPQELPAVNAIISCSGNQVFIYHDGGDSLTSDDLSILVNGYEVSFFRDGNPAPWTWSAGDTLNYTISSGTPQTVRVIYKPGSYTIASANFADTGTGSGPVPPPSGSDPVKAGFTGTPTTGVAPLPVSFTGSSPGSPSSWSWTFGDGGTASVRNPAHMYISPGTYTVSLTVSNGTGSDTLTMPGYIVVNTAGPVADFSGSPLTGPPPLAVTFTDSSTGTPTLWNWSFGDGSFSEQQSPSHTYTGLGAYTVSLNATNAGGSNTMTKPGYVSVTYSAPEITAIHPDSGNQAVSVPVSVAGTNFLAGANVTLRRSGYNNINASSVNVLSSNLISCQFNTYTAEPGEWDVVVTNIDGQYSTLAGGFTVMLPPPTISAFGPSSANRGWPISSTISGANFQSGATVRLNRTGQPDIIATGVSVTSSATISCTFNLAEAQTGQWNVVVENPDGQEAVRTTVITINSPRPVLSSRNPTSGNRGWPVTIISLTGTGFQPGATVLIRRSGSTDINATGVNVVSSTSINAGTIDLLGVTTGTWYYVVVNTDGQASTSTSRTITVNSNRPRITGITPNTGARGSTIHITNLAGTGFQPGATVQLRNTTTIISTTSNVFAVSPTQITCDFTIPSTSRAQVYNVVITNTDTQTRTTTNLFTVT